jgi:hypothetical protein
MQQAEKPFYMPFHKDLEKLYSIKFYFYTLEDYILYTYEYT